MKKHPSPVSRLLSACIAILVIAIACSSCANTRKLVYLQGKFDTAALSQISVVEPVIQKGDLLSIVVYSDNPLATALYNQASTGSTGTPSIAISAAPAESSTGAAAAPSASSAPGYSVDERGNIQFPGLGLLHIEGLTRQQLKDTLTERLDPFLKNPYFTVRFLNYKFTMLGEVTRPGIYNIPGDHINLLEALGMAGDMTFFGRRDNILVIRENNGKREFARLDITKPDIIGSPYFTLQQKDIVIVEPTKKKVAANDQGTLRAISIAATIISAFAIVYSIFK
jgi:polysaccharide export outer membrane protein